MLSDDSSSESETGRFKSNAKPERISDKQTSEPNRHNEPLRDVGKSRINDRSYGRSYDRRNEDRGRFERRRSRDRYESSRRPVSPRQRRSRERSYERRSYREQTERLKHRDDRDRDFKKSSEIGKRRSTSPTGPHSKRNFRDEIKKNIIPVNNERLEIKKYSEEKVNMMKEQSKEFFHSSDKHSKLESDKRPKEKLEATESEQKRSKSRTYSKDEESEEEKPASYYNLIPAKDEFVVLDETVHQVTDSSEDEEKLRAKLLNLEKQLDKTKKKKSKKSKKKSKSKQKESADSIEVSSTTDIQELEDNGKDRVELQKEVIEVSSTQTMAKKETSEEGELSTDDESGNIPIDPSDLRHRLKKSIAVADTSGSPDLRDKLKPKLEVAGPALPPHLQSRMEKRSPTPEREGPALPPHLKKHNNIGPTIPDNMRTILAESSHNYQEQYASSEDEGIGPLPADSEVKWKDAHKRLEERALHMRISELEGSSRKADIATREEWMLELPDAKAKQFGLGPRQFRAREAPDMSDRSSWTDTPKEKALKAAGVVPIDEASTTTLQREAHDAYIAERDRAQEKAAKKHKKKHKRDESLLDIHQKNLKKKKKKEEKEEGGKTRRPFDRNIDLQANRFDEAQKKSIIKKAQLLDTRFSAGQAKYL